MRSACLVALLLAGCAESDRAAERVPAVRAEWFTDIAHDAGVDFVHDSGHAGPYLMPEIMGSGAALADVDGDGDVDLYLVQGAARNAVGNALYLNDGTGQFHRAPDDHGSGDTGYGMGVVAAADYDADGDVDLYVTNVGANVLLANDGAGHFTDVTDRAGVGDTGWGTAAMFADLDGDADLDLLVVNYIVWSPAVEPDCYQSGVQTYCAPEHFNAPQADRLYRNNGDGTFTDVSRYAGLNLIFGNGLGAAINDFDDDGVQDLFVANDMNSNQLWRGQGGLRFAEEAMMRGVAVDEHGDAKAGMGVALADVDDDGDPDLLVVNLEKQSDSLYRNDGALFADATAAMGLSVVSRRFTRFGVALADFDNDGYLDLYEANGRIMPGEPLDQDVFAEPNVLMKGRAGGFVPVSPQDGTKGTPIATSRGVAVADVDRDGGLDIVVVNRDAVPHLLRNVVSNRGGYLWLRVLGAAGGDAIGARVEVELAGSRTLTRWVQPSGSYLSSSEPAVHFGLGSATINEVRVVWPDGHTRSFGILSSGRHTLARFAEG